MCSSRKYPHPPRKGLKIPEGGGFKGPGTSGEGEGYCLNKFCFFPDQSQFSYRDVVLAFCLSSPERKKNKSC